MDLKKNLGWHCTEPHPFQKSFKSQCRVHRCFFELHFIIEENNFLTRVDRHTFVDRVIKKLCKEEVFNEFFSRAIIKRMTIPTGKN